MDNNSDLNNLSSADGIIRLINGEILDPEEFDKIMKLNCHYIQHIVVTGNDRFYPLALIFPDTKLYTDPDYVITPLEGCFCPRNTNDMGKCLTGCMRLANNELENRPGRIQKGIIINDDTIFANGVQVLSDNEILEKYAQLIEDIYHGKTILVNDTYLINSKQIGSYL